MAISRAHYEFLRNLQRAGHLSTGGSLLEIGQANWFGDMPLGELAGEGCNVAGCSDLFEVAKRVYDQMFAPDRIDAIDLTPGSDAWQYDLNEPIELMRHYDVVINHGTAEHVFRIGQVFETIHDAACVGGLMIHDAPLKWLDHGFYCLQPTLFYDLAEANNYKLLSLATGAVDGNVILLAAMLKQEDAPFCVPMQGRYRESIAQRRAATNGVAHG